MNQWKDSVVLSQVEYRRRNRKIKRRFLAGDKAAQIAHDNDISYTRTMQIIAEEIHRGEHWYDGKLSTRTRNCILNELWDEQIDPWALPEREAAKVVAKLLLEGRLRCTPGL